MTRFAAKWYLFALLILLTVGAPAGAEEPRDPIAGTWTMITHYRGETPEARLVITRTATGLAGTWKSPRGTQELEELAFVDGTLTFVRVIDQGPRKLNIAFSAKVDGDRLKGEHRLPREKATCWGARGAEALAALRIAIKKELAPDPDPEADYERHKDRRMPRDGFDVLFDPKLVPAAEASMIRDNEPVIGVALGKEAKAYPISIMGRHELANDTCGGKPILTSW